MTDFNTKTWTVSSRIKHAQVHKLLQYARQEKLTPSAFVAKLVDQEVERRERSA